MGECFGNKLVLFLVENNIVSTSSGILKIFCDVAQIRSKNHNLSGRTFLCRIMEL